MFLVDKLILVTSVLLLLGIASSKFSARIGVPVLVLFLLVGMLAGSEGIGGIAFENYELAHGIGTLALALILFDGGLRTPLKSIRASWGPSFVLATVGVLITALVTGAAAAWILNLSLLEGLLLGSIIGSTDAAAVFATLRYGGVQLSEQLSSTLEVESGANDPMAIFLTLGCVEVLSGHMEFGPALIMRFMVQMVAGCVAGVVIGKAGVWLINRVNLDAAGLYPVLATACGLFAFGLAVAFQGSGFLAVYLAGIVMGNSNIVFKRGILLFHDAGAWFAQIVMFTVLGLLSFPSRLVGVAGYGLLVTAVLIFVARPVAVALTLFPFRYNWRELAFMSWVGLKGAVPITLATFPLLYEIPGAAGMFDVVFFVVVASAAIQGWTMPMVARRLRVDRPAEPTPPVTLEISSLRHVDGDIVDFTVGHDSRAAGRRVRELALPEGVVIAMITRGQKIIPPHGNTSIEVGDHVIIVLRPDTRPLVNNIFAGGAIQREELPPQLEFPLRGSATVGELAEFYGISIDAPADETLNGFLRRQLETQGAHVGASVTCGPIVLSVRSINEQGFIDRVGMQILPSKEAATEKPARSKFVPITRFLSASGLRRKG